MCGREGIFRTEWRMNRLERRKKKRWNYVTPHLLLKHPHLLQTKYNCGHLWKKKIKNYKCVFHVLPLRGTAAISFPAMTQDAIA